MQISIVRTRKLFLGLLLTASAVLAVDLTDICDVCSCSSAVINCSSKGLRDLPFFINNATEVEILDLSYNNFSSMPSAILRNLVRMKSLYLSNNPLSATDFDNVTEIKKLMSATDFGSVTGIEELILDGNVFPHLKAAFFEDFAPSLNILSLKNCSIQTVEQNFFSIFKHLQELDLDYNPIQVLEGNLFYGLAVDTLSLQNCRISTIHSGAFNQSSIRTLKLNNNDLTMIGDIDFSSFSELVLSNNRINSISGAIFTGQVYLDHNRLVDANFENLDVDFNNLWYLDISFNQLTRLPNLSTSRSTLEQLRAHDNQILQLGESDLSGMSRLGVLDLSNNNIARVSNNALSDCISLWQLILTNNNVIDLPNLHNLSNLFAIYLSHNNITSLPSGIFQGLESLQYLYLDYNAIRELPLGIFEDLVSLIQVVLSYNNIETLQDNVFPKTTSNIDLSNNNIASISPKAFENNSISIQILDLSSNTFSEWAIPESGFPNLIFLSLFNITELNQVPDLKLCACVQPVVLYFTYPAQCCKWENSFNVTCYPILYSGLDSVCISPSNKMSLQVLTWLILVFVLLGNIFVLFVMLASKEKIKVPQFFISNLAFADFCIGVYLAIFNIIDAKTNGALYQMSQWHYTPACSAAAYIAIFSAELSSCMMVCITIDRVYTIYRSPKPGISMSTAIIIAVVCCLTSLLFAAFPVINGTIRNTISPSSELCIPIFTNEDIESDKIYIRVLLAMRVVAFLIIIASYVAIFFTVCRSPAIGQRRKDTITLLRKTVPLIVADFVCWFPIIFVVWSFFSLERMKWLVVFVFPLNACANPFIYSIITENFRHRIRSMVKRIPCYRQALDAIHFRMHLGRSKNTCKETRGKVIARSYKVNASTRIPVFNDTLHGHEERAEYYMGRSASLPSMPNHSFCSLQLQMLPTLQINSVSNVFGETESQVAIVKYSNSDQLNQSFSVRKEKSEVEDIDTGNKCAVSTQSGEHHAASDHVAMAPCCCTQDLKTLNSCCSSSSSNVVAIKASQDYTQQP